MLGDGWFFDGAHTFGQDVFDVFYFVIKTTDRFAGNAFDRFDNASVVFFFNPAFGKGCGDTDDYLALLRGNNGGVFEPGNKIGFGNG